MKNKISLALCLVLASVKAFSQDTTKTNQFIANDFAIVEISRNSSFSDEETTIHFDNGTWKDVADEIYNTNRDLALYNKKDVPFPLKVLTCIKYMKARNYFLISSTALNIAHPTLSSSYDYQYIFEKREK